MQHIDIYQNEKSFIKTLNNQIGNAVDIEMASEEEEFTNTDNKLFATTEFKLKLFENVLMTKYGKTIKDSCTIYQLDSKANHKYKYRPEALSTDLFNTPALWYILLYVNNCEDVSEFHDFDYVLVPSIETILKCLTNLEFIKKKETL